MKYYELITQSLISNPKKYDKLMLNSHNDICYYMYEINTKSWYTLIEGDDTYIKRYKNEKNIFICNIEYQILYYNSRNNPDEFLFIDINNRKLSLENINTSKYKSQLFYINIMDGIENKNRKLSFVWDKNRLPRYIKDKVPVQMPLPKELVLKDIEVEMCDPNKLYDKLLSLGMSKEDASNFIYTRTTFDDKQFTNQIHSFEHLFEKFKLETNVRPKLQH